MNKDDIFRTIQEYTTDVPQNLKMEATKAEEKHSQY